MVEGLHGGTPRQYATTAFALLVGRTAMCSLLMANAGHQDVKWHGHTMQNGG